MMSEKITLKGVKKLNNELDEKEKIIIRQELELIDLRVSLEKKNEIEKANLDHINSLKTHLATKDEVIANLKEILSEYSNKKYNETEEKLKLAELQYSDIRKKHQQLLTDNLRFKHSVVYPL